MNSAIDDGLTVSPVNKTIVVAPVFNAVWRVPSVADLWFTVSQFAVSRFPVIRFQGEDNEA